MPLYQYVCDECQIEAEIFMTVDERDEMDCECGHVRRVISVPAIRGETVARS